jgi:hypothetical protein
LLPVGKPEVQASPFGVIFMSERRDANPTVAFEVLGQDAQVPSCLKLQIFNLTICKQVLTLRSAWMKHCGLSRMEHGVKS